jgi:hypothetical protein
LSAALLDDPYIRIGDTAYAAAKYGAMLPATATCSTASVAPVQEDPAFRPLNSW